MTELCERCGDPVATEHDIQLINGMHDDPPSSWWHQRCWHEAWSRQEAD